MKEITLVNQNPSGLLLTWPEHEVANLCRLEVLTDTFNFQLVSYLDGQTAFIPRDQIKSNNPYRIHYLLSDGGQEFSLETTELFYYQSLERINLVSIKSYEGGALSFYSDSHFDLYRVYELTPSPQLLIETEDCHVSSQLIAEGKTYQVEGYKRDDEGQLTLSALSEPYSCHFRLPKESTKPKVSVIIPVYNCQAFLSRTVDSVLLSSFQDLELILVNDGSKDSSGEICDWYQNHYANVRAIHKENLGVCSARNRGLDEARGEFLAFVDNDDLVHPYMYQKLYEAAQNNKTDIAIGQTISRTDINDHKLVLALSGEKSDVANYSYQEMIDAKGTNKNIYFVAVWNKIVRSSVARKVRFLDDIPYYEDTAYTSSLYTYIDKFTMVKGAYYIWDKRKQKTVGTATNSYKSISSDLLWYYYLVTLVSPLFQGNKTNPSVAETSSLDVMKKLLEDYRKHTTQKIKNMFSGIIKFYVREYQIPLEHFRDSSKTNLQDLYASWQEIAASDVEETDGWKQISQLRQMSSK